MFRSTADLNVLQGSVSSQFQPTELKFSPDGTLAYQSTGGTSQIDVFQTATHQLVRTRTLPGGAHVANIGYRLSATAVNRESSRIFVAGVTSNIPYQTALYVYPATLPPEPPRPPRILLNVSTRLRAQTGEDVLIGGFILTGTERKKVIMRAVGPSLALTGKLADPTLELHSSDGTLMASNDNWNAHRSDVLSTGIPPANERESAIVATLDPGAYTAILRGLAGTSGIALVEVYDLHRQAPLASLTSPPAAK